MILVVWRGYGLQPVVRWIDQTIYYVDFEGNVRSGVLEYGVVAIVAGEITWLETRLCAPVGSIRMEDEAIHGLNARQLSSLKPFSCDFDQFASWREVGWFAAHFASAENSMIKSVWPYCRSAPTIMNGRSDRGNQWGPWIDTGRVYPQLYPHLQSAGLSEVIAALELQRDLDALAERFVPVGRRTYHTAPYDALAGALLLSRLAHRPEWAGQTLNWLLCMSELNGGKRDELRQISLW